MAFSAHSRTFLALLTVGAGLCLGLGGAGASTLSDTPDLETVLREGGDLMWSGDFSGALQKYRDGIAMLGENVKLLSNAGEAAFLLGRFDLAIDYWQEAASLDNDNWGLREKLMQAYESAGQPAAFDRERQALLDLHREGRVTSLRGVQQFWRGRFRVNGRWVLVFEAFERKVEFGSWIYYFRVLKEDGVGEDFHLTFRKEPSFGGYVEGQWYSLDSTTESRHATHEVYEKEPTYAEVRAEARHVIHSILQR